MTGSNLVLGSSSVYRARMLQRLGVSFIQESPMVDERSFDGRLGELGAEGLALTLARAKADSLRRRGAVGARMLLCADQVGVLELEGAAPRLLHKPGTVDACVEQLMALSGRTHALVNGIVLLDESTGDRHELVDRQELTMRAFGESEARAYVELREPLDCAGGYRIEDEGIRLFDRIRSDDHTGIIGLPLLGTAKLLRAAGLLE